ncbi:CoA pyrophosphatase [Aeromonas salmonicida]|uniref:CoA pyrophosphatase n=1 Tax=Aeromonas salmonicida TaxID=645 RepID=UPI001BA9F7A3|nr:CoA pyrophosphatase [Aeromonas salmonicida]MBS2781380.1 CoA pyrophosphatase [Aeromonas salmonicida]MDM5064866.1 CoA pyrophosphatase [Aeromonas salmonicida]
MDRAELLTRFLLQRPAPAHRLTVAGLKPAAVLLPLVERADGLQLLLTRRSAHLRHHAGQISFPGGRQDPGDHTLIHTALRETWEELGIIPAQVEIIGTLAPLNTISQYDVLPVLGLIAADYQLTLSQDEVAQAFEVPLHHLLDPRHHIALTIPRADQLHTIYWIPWQDHFIWGATASMIRQLSHQLAM